LTARRLAAAPLLGVLVASAAGAATPSLADQPYDAVKQAGLDNLEAEREDEALRYLAEAASRPEAAGDLDLLFLTAHLLRDACRISEMRALLPRAQNAAELVGRGDLAADAQALSEEAGSAYGAVEVRITPRFVDWDDHAEAPKLALSVTRAPSNPALTACVPRVAARWSAQLAGLARARAPLAETPGDAWRLSAELPLAEYGLSWPTCRRAADEAEPCPTGAFTLTDATATTPKNVDFALPPTLPSDERPLIRSHHWPWLIGGAAVVVAGGLVAVCLGAQPVSICQ
jgi:hypothetical protein